MDNDIVRHLVLCPFCDNEQRVEREIHISSCRKCGKPFNSDPDVHSHPQEFWANPETSARF